jgi:uncharacterized phiE125 gp8 family phage protein
MLIITPLQSEPVTVEEAMAAARLDDAETWTPIVAAHISAAREYCEHLAGRFLMQQTLRAELTDWPSAGQVLPVYRPSAVAVSYWNGSAFVVLDPAAYAWDASGQGFEVAPALGTDWPELAEKAVGHRVRIDATAGAETSDQVPACAKLFIKALVVLMIDSPTLTAQRAVEANQYLVRILDPLRLYA